ncbi:hypothetical protein [Ammoniphilus resinae]|uniref:Yip1 domain-containing protein n=1 Tax=Ammoniphilus resinae TaxID=861532 RepID=A0ABS4GX58_9BACL|nr:hypothetical protein [Ammoniphilus resinae]MBP1934836.1 hypothetical protein [Ammoniphilus resinae]
MKIWTNLPFRFREGYENTYVEQDLDLEASLNSIIGYLILLFIVIGVPVRFALNHHILENDTLLTIGSYIWLYIKTPFVIGFQISDLLGIESSWIKALIHLFVAGLAALCFRFLFMDYWYGPSGRRYGPDFSWRPTMIIFMPVTRILPLKILQRIALIIIKIYLCFVILQIALVIIIGTLVGGFLLFKAAIYYVVTGIAE